MGRARRTHRGFTASPAVPWLGESAGGSGDISPLPTEQERDSGPSATIREDAVLCRLCGRWFPPDGPQGFFPHLVQVHPESEAARTVMYAVAVRRVPVTDDPLAPARGVLIGLVISIALWVVIVAAWAVLFR